MRHEGGGTELQRSPKTTLHILNVKIRDRYHPSVMTMFLMAINVSIHTTVPHELHRRSPLQSSFEGFTLLAPGRCDLCKKKQSRGVSIVLFLGLFILLTNEVRATDRKLPFQSALFHRRNGGKLSTFREYFFLLSTLKT